MMRRLGSLGGSHVTKTSEAGRVLRSLAVTDEFEVEEAAGAKFFIKLCIWSDKNTTLRE